MENLISLFIEGSVIETTPAIAEKYELKEFDEIPDTATLLSIVLETDRLLAREIKK